MRAQRIGGFGEFLQDVPSRRVLERVHGIQPQPVDVVVAHPHEGVLDDVATHFGLVQIDRRSPGVPLRLAKVRTELRQIVAARTEVVVHDVLDDPEPATVAGIDEALVRRRPAVAFVHRVPEHAVVAPVVGAVEGVHRQQLHEPDAEIDEVIEARDRGVEGAIGCERADMQLVDDRSGQLATRPVRVLPHVRGRVEPRAQLVHAAWLATRAGIGTHGRGAVEHETVLVAVVQVDVSREPAAVARRHRGQPETRAVQLHPFAPGRPDLDHADTSPAVAGTSRATG